MENIPLSKHSVSFGLSLALTAVINALIVVAKEKSDTVMAGMKKATGHHWTTHSILVLGLFGFFAWIFGRANHGRGTAITASSLFRILVSGIAVASIIIVGFYLIAD